MFSLTMTNSTFFTLYFINSFTIIFTPLMKQQLFILLAATVLFTACNNEQTATTQQQPYTDLKNDCYKGKVKKVTKTEYEGTYYANGKWNKPTDAVATVRFYNYDTAGYSTGVEEFYLYHDTLYTESKQEVVFKDGMPAVKNTYNPAGVLIKRTTLTTMADTGFTIDVYDSANTITQRQVMLLNKDGRQKTSDFTYFDRLGQTSQTLSFSFIYNDAQLLDSLKLKMYDGRGTYLPEQDILLVPSYLEKDAKDNPTLTVLTGYGAAKGTNMLIEYEYEYYE